MTFAEETSLATDATFLARVEAVAVRKAVVISAETAAGLRPPRKQLAIRVLQNPTEEARGLARVVVRDTTIAAKNPLNSGTVSDAEITAALSDAVWDGYAQAFAL